MRIHPSKGVKSENFLSEAASSEISQATTLRDDFQELRANYILEKFDVAPEYVYVDKIEVMDIASAAAYAMMRETMAAPPGSSMPAFFVNENQGFQRFLFVHPAHITFNIPLACLHIRFPGLCALTFFPLNVKITPVWRVISCNIYG